MSRLTRALAFTLAAFLIPFVQSAHQVRASGGTATTQTVAVYRQSCGSTGQGSVAGTARFSPDDQGGNPGGLEIRTGVTSGLPRTAYTVSLLEDSCQTLTTLGTLTTDDRGRGDLDAHVAASLLPPGAQLRVQLIAPNDTLTSDPVSGF